MATSPRTVLITGATAGIGAATARALAPDHRLVLVGRRTERLAALVAELRTAGGEAWGITADLTGENVPRGVVEQAIAHAGTLDAVVNNAGIFETAAIGSITAEHLDRHWRLNVLAPILLTQAAMPHLRGAKAGWVVNLSSVAAESAFPGCGVYAGTKAAIEAWSRSLREELRGANVRVAVVAPGATDTEIWPADTTFDRTRMCRAGDVASTIRHILTLPPSASIDRVLVMPPGGPL